MHSKCPSHTLSEHALTWCPGPIFHVFSYFARCRCDIDLRGVLVYCWVKIEDGDTKSYQVSSVIQDSVFLCWEVGSINGYQENMSV